MSHVKAEDRLSYQRSYSAANREQINAKQREYRGRNKEKHLQWVKEYNKKPENIAKTKERSKRYWRNNWSVYKCMALKSKARRSNLDFNLEPSDLILPTHCPVFGIPLVISDSILSGNSPSVDRIDNSKGYVKGNVVIVSHKANSMKRAATVVEMRQLADFYEKMMRVVNNE